MFLKYFLAWFPMLILAILNGTLRDLVYKKWVGELAAHQISTISLIIFLGCYMFLIVANIPPKAPSQTILLGLFWMMLTLGFEFGFGRYRGLSWQQMFADYNIVKGRIWILIPIWIAIGPYLICKMTMTDFTEKIMV
jgi:hypothetical protein